MTAVGLKRDNLDRRGILRLAHQDMSVDGGTCIPSASAGQRKAGHASLTCLYPVPWTPS